MPFDDTRTGHGVENRATEVHESADTKRQYTLKGVEIETIDLMRSAAKKEGMKVGAWVSARLREAARKALGEDKGADEFAEIRDQIRKVEENQILEREDLRENLRAIQDELRGVLRTQNSIMSKILSQAYFIDFN
jgi:hypothetical protein